MKNMAATKEFLTHGGSELGAGSTSASLEIALRYAKDWDAEEQVGEKSRSLIFRVIVDDFMHLGPDLRFLSAYPHEEEALYPPLTFFKPCSKSQPPKLTYNGTEFTIVDVKPTFPS